MTDPIKPDVDASVDVSTDDLSAASDHHDEPIAEPAAVNIIEDVTETVAERRSFGSIALWLAVTFLLLIGLSLGVAGYQVWQWYQNIDGQYSELKVQAQLNAEALSRYKSEMVGYGQSTSKIEEKVQGVLSKADKKAEQFLKQQEALLQQMGARLDGQQKRINTLSTTSREDWLLAEAEYLLRLANQRVLLEHNAQNAIALMEAADAIVKEVAAGLGDPELFAIRKALGRELTQLRLIDHTDKEGLYIQLASLADEVEHLPRVRPTSLTAASPGKLIGVDEPAASGWGSTAWSAIKQSAGLLTQYIKISEASSPAVPLMGDESALVVAMNVRLLMQQAQLAILKEEPTIYRYSLEKASMLIATYYIDSPPVAEFKLRIEQHLAVDIAPDMPDISSSLKLLNGFVKKLHKIKG